MCDYSLQNVKSRPASVGDKLVTHNFGTGTNGFASVDDKDVAVCVLPGTEIAFDEEIKTLHDGENFVIGGHGVGASVAIFRQIDKETRLTHHDALELPAGSTIKLAQLMPGQTATVLQLPAAPKTEAEAEEQKRLETVG